MEIIIGKIAKFALSCSLRSHHKATPTQKMATPLFALPARHPIRKKCVTLKNNFLKINSLKLSKFLLFLHYVLQTKNYIGAIATF